MAFACKKEVTIDDEKYSKKLVPQCLFNPDSLWTVSLSETASILKNEEVGLISNGSVLIKDEDGQLIEELPYLKNGIYRSQINKPILGKRYRIEVKSQNYPDLTTASDIVPGTVNFTVDTVSIERNESQYIQLSFNIKDNPDEENFYIIRVMKRENYYDGTIYQNNYWLTSNDIYIDKVDENNFENEFSGSYIFLRDENINGKDYTLKCEIYKHNLYNYYNEDDSNKTYLIVTSCSEDCYKYLLSNEKARLTYDDPMISPMNLHTNFSNRIGIFGGYKDNVIEFKRELPND